eukprot:7180240-Alexandrium_andersonii.AAC.1
MSASPLSASLAEALSWFFRSLSSSGMTKAFLTAPLPMAASSKFTGRCVAMGASTSSAPASSAATSSLPTTA